MVKIGQLGQFGVIKDADPGELAPNAWSDGNNFMCKDGRIESALGELTVFDQSDMSITPVFIDIFRSSDGWTWIYAGEGQIWAVKPDGTHQQVGTFSNTGGEIQGVSFSGVYVINNGLETPKSWDGDFLNSFVSLANWPATNPTCKSIVAYKNFLFMLNVTESGTDYGKMVWWSSPADPGSVPPSWDYTDPEEVAGRTELSGEGGVIVCGELMGDRLMIYRERAVDVCNFVGGTLVFKFGNIFTNIGAKGQKAVASIGGRHAVFVDDDLIIHDGSSYESVINGRLRNWLKTSVNPEYSSNCMAIHVLKDSEVWFGFPEIGKEYATKAYRYNYITKETGIIDLGNVSAYAIGPYEFGASQDTWDGVTGTWDTALQLWNEVTDGNSVSLTALCRPLDDKITIASSALTDDGNPLSGYIERIDLQIPGFNPNDIVGINELAPYIELRSIPDGADIKFYVGSKMTKQGGYTWNGPYKFDPQNDFRITPVVVGRWIGIRVKWTLKGQLKYSGHEINAVFQGRY